jgi:hypothetical protein
VHNGKAQWFSRFRFWIFYPFVITAFYWRQQREQRRITPIRWLSSGGLLEEDLESSFGEIKNQLDPKFIEDFAKARDDTLSLIKKQMFVSLAIFVFLAANALSVALDFSIAGFSLKTAPGVPEALLLISNLLACYTLILQGNCALLDTAIRAAIKHFIPEELRSLYLVRFFPHENTGSYRPFNLPHVIPTRFTQAISNFTVFFRTHLVGVSAH